MKNHLEFKTVPEGQESGQVVGKNSPPATTHGSFAQLKQRIQRNTRKYYGRNNSPQYVMRIQRRRRREWFELGSDLDAGAKLAREIDQHLRLHGWDETRRKYKPAFEAELCDLTVGAYLELVAQHAQLWPATFHYYASRFRRIVGDICRIKYIGSDKYSGGSSPSKWRLAVDKVLLNSVTPEKISTWRDGYVARFEMGSLERTHAEHTVNGILRNARSLFTKRTLKRVLVRCPNLVMPVPLPFVDVELISERESDFFYVSQVEPKQLIEEAFKELSGNKLIIFILAIGAGMRRNEIDKLPREHVDAFTGAVTIAPTKYNRLKSEASVGKVQLEPRFAEALRQHLAQVEGDFVLSSPIEPRCNETNHRHYRCARDFTELCAWLRTKGINRSTSCIHTLRKEFGSHLAERRGIFAASAGLRHSTIAVTRKYYVSSKIEPTAFFAADEPTVAPIDTAQLLTLLKQAVGRPHQPFPAEPAEGGDISHFPCRTHSLVK